MKPSEERFKKGLWWDRAWSLVSGCTPMSEGCLNCWSARETAMRANHPNPKIRERNAGLVGQDGLFNGQIRVREDLLDLPFKTKKPTVWAIWNDLFHECVPFGFIHRVWEIMKRTPHHQYMVLTKRPERMAEVVNRIYSLERFGWAKGFWNHVWLGVTVENQFQAEKRLPVFLQIPAAVRFVSVEPMLGVVDLSKFLCGSKTCEDFGYCKGTFTRDCSADGLIRLVFCGCESGPGRRPFDQEWARDLKDQCVSTETPFFFKQSPGVTHGSVIKLPILDGQRWDQWPEDK